MVEHAWVKHPATDQVAEVPVDAIPQLMQSGWERMPDKEVADRNKTADEELAETEAAMRAKAAEGALFPEEASAETAEQSADQTAGKRPAKSSATKGND